MGHAQVTGRGEEAIEHLRGVNRWSLEQAVEHVEAAPALWQRRSEERRGLDSSMLTAAGITVVAPQAAAERPAHAARALASIGTPATGPRPAPGPGACGG